MALGKASGEVNSAPKTAAEDATLDIVRLLVETEARHAEAHVDRQATAGHDTGDVPVAPRVAPRRVTLLGKPQGRGGRPLAAPEVAELEDLRPRRFGLKLPRLGRKPAVKPAAKPVKEQSGAPRMNLNRKDMARYGKLAALVAVGLVVLFRPWLIPLLLFMAVWLGLIVFLLLGSARVSELGAAAWEYYQQRRPKGAAKIVTRLQNAADRLDGILARMPARVADGIYTPDLGRSARDMAQQNRSLSEEDPFARLGGSRSPAE